MLLVKSHVRDRYGACSRYVHGIRTCYVLILLQSVTLVTLLVVLERYRGYRHPGGTMSIVTAYTLLRAHGLLHKKSTPSPRCTYDYP